MSMPRPYQFIALRRLAVTGRQCRNLHIAPSKADTVTRDRASTTALNGATAASRPVSMNSNAVRKFNSSRVRQPAGENSSIDTTYMPDFDTESKADGIIVPMLHSERSHMQAQSAEQGAVSTDLINSPEEHSFSIARQIY